MLVVSCLLSYIMNDLFDREKHLKIQQLRKQSLNLKKKTCSFFVEISAIIYLNVL